MLLHHVDEGLHQAPRIPGVVVVGEQTLGRTTRDVWGRLSARRDHVREAMGRLVGAAQQEVAHPAEKAGYVAMLGLRRHLRLECGLAEKLEFRHEAYLTSKSTALWSAQARQSLPLFPHDLTQQLLCQSPSGTTPQLMTQFNKRQSFHALSCQSARHRNLPTMNFN